MVKPIRYRIVVYAIAENGDGKVIEIKEFDERNDAMDLPPLGAGWIYNIAREAVYEEDKDG